MYLQGGLSLAELGLVGSRCGLPVGDALLVARHHALHLLPQRQRLLGRRPLRRLRADSNHGHAHDDNWTQAVLITLGSWILHSCAQWGSASTFATSRLQIQHLRSAESEKSIMVAGELKILRADLHAGSKGGLVGLHALALLVPGLLPALALLDQALHVCQAGLVLLLHSRHRLLALTHCRLRLLLRLLGALRRQQTSAQPGTYHVKSLTLLIPLISLVSNNVCTAIEEEGGV